MDVIGEQKQKMRSGSRCVMCKQTISKRYGSGSDKLVVESLQELDLDSICFDKIIGGCVSF